jgi:hypothetical protein
MPMVSATQPILERENVRLFRHEQYEGTSLATRVHSAPVMITELLPVVFFTFLELAVSCAVMAFTGTELATWGFSAE